MIAESYMHYCLTLAKLGRDQVHLNPMVGAAIVANNRIIGKGYHQKFGGHHAEVNALNSVQKADEHLLKESTLFVNLEPCAHFGKTPPCADLVIKSGINKVVIALQDPNPLVAGKGIQMLRDAGIKVRLNVLKNEAAELNEAFTSRMLKKRPYITLKWAQNQYGFMAATNEQIWISNELSRRYVHKLRSRVDAILVGANTLNMDNPKLNNRYYPGKQPLRLVIDPNNKTHKSALAFKINPNYHRFTFLSQYDNDVSLNQDTPIVQQVVHFLFKKGVGSLLVEGGAFTLSHFINAGFWDKIIQIEGEKKIAEGIVSPIFKGRLNQVQELANNSINIYSQT